MKFILNDKGFALITSLMFTVLALVISMSLLYMVTSGIKSSSSSKQYQTVLAAAYGGTEIVSKDLISAAFSFKNMTGLSYVNSMKNTYMAGLDQPNVSNCLRVKISLPRSQWGACSDSIINPKSGTDISFNLRAASGSPYTVYTKIVDTMERKFQVYQSYTGSRKLITITKAGNTSESSDSDLNLDGTTPPGGMTVPHYPYIYRIEVQGERSQNAAEKSNLTVLYAY